MADLVLEHVCKRYGDGHLAVDDVSLAVADGELVVLVGPSGCGKSTLLRMIAGLEEISSGELRIAGARANELPPRTRDLAMVFQSYALYPHLTVFENIAFPLRVRRGASEAEIRRRVEHAAELLGLSDLLARRPAQLSGGQRQRVAMGRALVREPRAFLFDEPLSNLDARLRGQMRAELARLQRSTGVTTLYVTHDQTEAMTLGDRVAVLRRGRLQQVGTPRDLYERPANLFVAGFLGSPPMNLLPARVAGGRLELPFTSLPCAAPGPLAGDVWVGLRPDAFASAERLDAATRARGVLFEVRIDVLEWLGSEQYAYVPLELADEQRERLAALDRDQGSETLRAQLVVAIDPASALRPGELATLWLDPTRVQLFDARSGERIAAAALHGDVGKGSPQS